MTPEQEREKERQRHIAHVRRVANAALLETGKAKLMPDYPPPSEPPPGPDPIPPPPPDDTATLPGGDGKPPITDDPKDP